MPWNTIASSLPADAVKMNENFNFVAGGTRLPRSSAGAAFASTDGAYDIGSENARWDELYVNNINSDNSVTTLGETLYREISKITLSATASSIEFTGLDGDSQVQYMIRSYIVTDTNTTIYMVMNGDSSASYGFQYLSVSGTSSYAGRLTSQTSILWGKSVGITTSVEKIYTEGVFYAKTGNERVGTLKFLGSCSDAYFRTLEFFSCIWSNSSSTITSIKFYNSDGNMETGTSISIWGRK